MKRIIIPVVSALLLMGCASNQSGWSKYLDNYKIPKGQTARFEAINEIREVGRTIQPPVPERTPFESNKAHKELYIQGFTSGWNTAVSGRTVSLTEAQVKQNPYMARGFSDGQNEYAEPLNDFLKRLRKSLRQMHIR